MSRMAVVMVVLLTLTGCGVSTRPDQTDAGAMADHTLDRHGVLHRPGLKDPTANCVACHGASLQGDEGPSCTKCHGKVW